MSNFLTRPRQRAMLIIAAVLLALGTLTAATARASDCPDGQVRDTPGGECVPDGTNGGPGEPPPVGPPTDSWRQLVEEERDNPAYRTCFEQRLGVPWSEAERAADLEDEGWDLQATLASNLTPEQAKQNVIDRNRPGEGTPDPDVISARGFSNTADPCREFPDGRAQGRVVLLLPGPDRDHPQQKGVIKGCRNPFLLFPPESPPVTQPPTTQPPTTVPPTTAPPTTAPPTTTTTVPPTTTTTVPPPEQPKCIDENGNRVPGSDPDGDGFCGTPTSGPEQQDEPSTAQPTPGYEPGNAEEVVENQPVTQEPVQTPYGADSGSEDGAPAGEMDGQQGTDSGTQDPVGTEGSGQTSSGDPGEPIAYTAGMPNSSILMLGLGALFLGGAVFPQRMALAMDRRIEQKRRHRTRRRSQHHSTNRRRG